MIEDRPLAIQSERLFFAYEKSALALEDASFQVREGEFMALLASNGSGKSTLIKVLAGLLKPDSGRVLIRGHDLNDIAPRDLYQILGLVLQDPNDQLFAPTVEEDVAFGPRNMKRPEQEVQALVTEALDRVSAGPLRQRAIHHLSFGERKKVSLAGVLAMRPSILLLDEPTAGLDPAGEASMLHLLNHLNRKEGITVVLATHSVDLLPLFADRITIMNRGRIIKVGTPEEVFMDQETVDRASLRLPYISRLVHEMRHYDGVKIDGLPLTVREARLRLLEIIPPDLIMRSIEEKG